MENVVNFLGGVIALAVLGFFLFFELSRESMIFAYLISALIILVLGAMLTSLRGVFSGFIRAHTGKLSRIKPTRKKGGKTKPEESEPVEEEKSELEAIKEKVKGEEDVKLPERMEAIDSCQICGSRNGLQKHYILPLNRGGKDLENNMILLCRIHKEQAEKGIYSESLLKKLKNA